MSDQPDAAAQAFTNLANALDPTLMSRSLNGTANDNHQGVVLIDGSSAQLLAADAFACARFDIEPQDLATSDLTQLLPLDDEQSWETLLQQPDDRVIRSRGGHYFRIVPLIGSTTNLALIVLLPTPSPEPQEQWRDVLTGLPDRRGLAAWHHWVRAAGRSQYALLFMDLVDFKQVNDRLGHAAGDQVLAVLAERWQGCVRDDDRVVRYGGDEFVVALAGINSWDDTQPVIERIVAATTQPIAVGEHQINVAVTIGVALSSDSCDDLAALIAAADRDMYRSKGQK